MRQLIVDLRVEMPNMSIRQIAEICDTHFHRRPSHHSIKTVLASVPPPSIQMRRFPLFDDTSDPAQRRHNSVQLHAEGWSVASIAELVNSVKSEQILSAPLRHFHSHCQRGNTTGIEVAKATPYLEGKPKGDKSRAEERAKRRSTST
jgi:hypothetical protein